MSLSVGCCVAIVCGALLCVVAPCPFVVWCVLFEVCCGVLFAIVFWAVVSFLRVEGSCYVWIGVWC